VFVLYYNQSRKQVNNKEHEMNNLYRLNTNVVAIPSNLTLMAGSFDEAVELVVAFLVANEQEELSYFAQDLTEENPVHDSWNWYVSIS
jgi:hypothetical protein